MSYVDAGYAVASGTLFVYAISLLGVRRWARALRASGRPVAEPAPPGRGAASGRERIDHRAEPADQPADARDPFRPGRALATPSAH